MWLSQELLLQTIVLRSLVPMKTKIAYYSLPLVPCIQLPPSIPFYCHFSKTVLQRKQMAGSMSPHPLTRSTNQCVHIRTKSLPLGIFPSNSLGGCPVACVSFIFLGLYFSLILNCANEESSAAAVPWSGFGSTQQVTGNERKKSSNFPLKLSLCSPAPWVGFSAHNLTCLLEASHTPSPHEAGPGSGSQNSHHRFPSGSSRAFSTDSFSLCDSRLAPASP